MLLAVLILAIAPATAFANPQDIATTHAYIEANYALARANVAGFTPGQAQIEHLNSELAQECPGVGAGSPETEASQPISHEVTVALGRSLTEPTPRRSARSRHGGAPALEQPCDHARRPDVCEKPARTGNPAAAEPLRRRALVEGDRLSMVPATIVALVDRVEAIEPKTIPSRLLAPYERGADAGIVARTTAPRKTKLEENESLRWATRLGQTARNARAERVQATLDPRERRSSGRAHHGPRPAGRHEHRRLTGNAQRTHCHPGAH